MSIQAPCESRVIVRHAERILEHFRDFEVSTLNCRIDELGPTPRGYAEDLEPQEPEIDASTSVDDKLKHANNDLFGLQP